MEMGVKCRCGYDDCYFEFDKISEVAFIECKGCGRAIGGLAKDEAIEMWNNAMARPEAEAAANR